MGEELNAQLNAKLKQLKADQQTIASKITELEMEVHEHNLVISATEKLETTRRCYRLIGGVLVERTVGEVLPVVTKNRDAIKDLISQLREQLTKKVQELNEFAVKYKIQAREASAEAEERGSKGKQSSGVLV